MQCTLGQWKGIRQFEARADKAALCSQRQGHPGPEIPGAVFQRVIVTEISSAEIHPNHSSGALLTVLAVLLAQGPAPAQAAQASRGLALTDTGNRYRNVG